VSLLSPSTGFAWFILVASGLLEVGWASLLPRTEGFTRLGPSLLMGALLVLSMVGISVATRVIPIGTAYPVWVGIGAVGAAVVGIAFYQEPTNALRLTFLVLLVASILGLRLTGGGSVA